MTFPPRLPRASTPSPTVPPAGHAATEAAAFELLKRTADRVGMVRVIVGVIAVIFMGGVGLALFTQRLATKEDLARESATRVLETAVLRSDAIQLRERVIATETDLNWIKGALYQIAKQTGATTVSPPPP